MKREVIWVGAAKKAAKKFPQAVQYQIIQALNAAALGGKLDTAKPLKGLGSGVFEVRVPYRTDAYRAVYAVQLGDAVYVVHAFQKKSTQGIATPRKEIDLIKSRLKRIRETLK